MPEYTYQCESCENVFTLYCNIKDYKSNTKCPSCGLRKGYRKYLEDLQTLNASVKKSDSELKTLGDLALRNTERMSEDEKKHIYEKNNKYKETPSDKPLPKGMSRIKKPPKPPKNFIERLQ